MKTTFTLLLSIFCATGIFAQCSPDQGPTATGIYPAVLSTGCVNFAYSDTVTLVFPLDTTVNIPPFGNITIPFDSFIVTSVTNLPLALTSSCGSITCTSYLAGPGQPARECLLINGMPSTVTPATTFDVAILAWVTILGSPTSFIDTVQVGIQIDVCSGVIAQEVQTASVFPNPANDQIALTLPSENSSGQLSIYDAQGRLVKSQVLNANISNINVAELEAGIYIALIECGETTFKQNLILE